MSDVLPWLEYEWRFDFPVGMFRAIVERARGTPARLEEALGGAERGRLTRRPEKGWSAQEHAGHLIEIERLWHVRLEEYARGEATLSAADMKNRRTEDARYNEREVGAILEAFRAVRADTVRTLDGLDLEAAARVAHHPRLDRPMRLVDLAFFAAEHDDHHLALIRERLR